MSNPFYNTQVEAASLPGIITPEEILADANEQLAKVKTLAETIQEVKVLPTDKIAPPDYLLQFRGAPMCSLGDFSLITGKAKSRKTLLISLFVAALLASEGVDGLVSNPFAGKTRIIWFDTEQSRYHSQRALKRAITRANSTGSNIEMYCLRPFSPRERVEMIEEVIIKQNEQSDIALVIIDGIRDLITDINNPDQATDIATKLMKWTESKHLHIMTLLHQNKGDSNARGHVGTELVNKAQTVISVEVAKESKDVSNVNPEQTREQPFEPFAISFDSEGLPSINDVVESNSSSSGGRKAAADPHSFDIAVHDNLCREIFSGKEDPLTYREMIEEIRLAFGNMGTSIGETKGKLMLAHWVKLNIIKNEGVNGSKGKYQRVRP